MGLSFILEIVALTAIGMVVALLLLLGELIGESEAPPPEFPPISMRDEHIQLPPLPLRPRGPHLK